MLVNLLINDYESFPSGKRFCGAHNDDVQIHHIFAKGHLDEDTDGLVSPDRLGNLTPLLQSDNEHLKDTPASDYFAEIVRAKRTRLLAQHSIPNDPSLWEAEAYELFCERREQLLAQDIRALLERLLE